MSFELYKQGIQSDKLLKNALENIQLFRDQNNCCHGIVNVGPKRSIIDIPSDDIARWLRRLFLYSKNHTFCPSEIELVSSYIESLVEDEEIEERPYFTRIGETGRTLYYDLGGKDHKIVVVTQQNKVKITDNSDCKVCFQKGKPQVMPNLEAQPEQLCDLLRPFFRLKNKKNFLLLAVYIVSCFIHEMNHPILILHGEAGSSKSSSVEAIGKIVDPHGSSNKLTMNPDRKGMIAALSHRYFLGFDNLDTALKKWQSDLLCNACTGGSEPMRVLYETNTLQEACIKGCVCLNGLTVVATEPDLLDRAILLELERIPDNEYMTENELNKCFEDVLPDILGAIFNTLHRALNLYDSVQYFPHTRMQDFAKWGYCIAEALGRKGKAFADLYEKNREQAKKESKPPMIIECLITMMRFTREWKGTMTELRECLWPIAKQRGYKNLDFPASASALSRQLGYYKESLASEGFTYSQHCNGDRKLEITNQNIKDDLMGNCGIGGNGRFLGKNS